MVENAVHQRISNPLACAQAVMFVRRSCSQIGDAQRALDLALACAKRPGAVVAHVQAALRQDCGAYLRRMERRAELRMWRDLYDSLEEGIGHPGFGFEDAANRSQRKLSAGHAELADRCACADGEIAPRLCQDVARDGIACVCRLGHMACEAGYLKLAKGATVYKTPHFFGVVHAKRRTERVYKRRRGQATVEHGHCCLDALQANRIAAAVIAKNVVPPVHSPEVAVCVHAKRGRAGASNDDNAWLTRRHTSPGAYHIILEKGHAAIVKQGNGALQDGQVEVGIESGDGEEDASHLPQRDIGDMQRLGDGLNNVGAGAFHSYRARVRRPGHRAANDAQVIAHYGGGGLCAATIYPYDIPHDMRSSISASLYVLVSQAPPVAPARPNASRTARSTAIAMAGASVRFAVSVDSGIGSGEASLTPSPGIVARRAWRG